jgi:hypothetical protein
MIKINYLTDINIIEPILNSYINDINKIYNKKYSCEKNIFYDDLNTQIETEISSNSKKNIKKKIISATNKINNKMHKKLMDIKNLYIWNICITKNNFMFNCPTTLSNVIFIPYRIIALDNFETILIHEKIHVFQRFNFDKWNNYIIKNTNFILSPPVYIKNELYNPDTLYNFTYVYKINNKKIKGYLDKELNVKWMHNNKNFESDELPKYEHPYEVYAYEMSEFIVK